MVRGDLETRADGNTHCVMRDVGGLCRVVGQFEFQAWAESGPTGVAREKPGVRAIAVVPLRARKWPHRPFETFAVSTAAATLSRLRAVLGHSPGTACRSCPSSGHVRAPPGGSRPRPSAIERAWMHRQRRPSTAQGSWRRAPSIRRISVLRELDSCLACSQKSWSRMASVRRHSSRPYSVQMPSPQ